MSSFCRDYFKIKFESILFFAQETGFLHLGTPLPSFL